MGKKAEFPAVFQSRLRSIVPAGIISNVLRGYEMGQPITGRANISRSNLKDIIKAFANERVEVVPHDEIPDAFTVIKGNFKKITETSLYKEGYIYLQSFSSQLPPLILNPKQGDRVLDMCAAPGGKTTQMAALMQNQGDILACETDQTRFERLEANVKRQEALIVKCLKVDARKLDPDRNGLFDRILLDAPCSSEGTFSLLEPKSFAHWNLDFVNQISQLQRQLIHTAGQLLNSGGTLLYSTCSLSPEENEVVLQDFLDKNPGFKLCSINMSYKALKGALPQWNGQKFDEQISRARRVYPSESTEGFFVALLKKEAS